jgi:hypothetical protein
MTLSAEIALGKVAGQKTVTTMEMGRIVPRKSKNKTCAFGKHSQTIE